MKNTDEKDAAGIGAYDKENLSGDGKNKPLNDKNAEFAEQAKPEQPKKQARDKKEKIKDWLTRIGAVFIALMLWLYVMSVESPANEMVFASVPVKIVEGSASLSVYSGYNNTVDITVQGKRTDINRYTRDDIEAFIDASEISKAGRYTLDVNIDLPPGLTLAGQSLNSVSVYLDNRSSATVPVTAKITGYMLAEGYELGESEIKTDIDEITVTGPKSVLDMISSAQARLQLGAVTSSVTIAGNLELVDESGSVVTNPYLKMSESDVIVTVPVYVYKSVPLVASYKYGYFNDKNVSITITPPFIWIKGESRTLNEITKINIAPIDEKNLMTDTLTVSLMLPEDVINVDGINDAVINVKHIGTSAKTYAISNINVINPNNLSYELLSESINVTLRGNEMYLINITDRDIEAVVDLSYLSNSAGTISTAVSINIADGYDGHVYEVGDYKISVKLK